MAEKTIQPASQEVSATPIDNGNSTPATREGNRYLIPPVDIYENEQGLTVVADLPGVDREGLEVKVDNNVLTIRGRVQKSSGGDVYREFVLLPFFRQFELTDEVDQDGIGAQLKHGVLTLNLPKKAKPEPKRITVRVD